MRKAVPMTNLGRNHANQIRHGVIRVHENAGNRLKNAGFRRFLFAFACILDDFHTCVGFMDKSIPEALFVKTGESDSEKRIPSGVKHPMGFHARNGNMVAFAASALLRAGQARATNAWGEKVRRKTRERRRCCRWRCRSRDSRSCR